MNTIRRNVTAFALVLTLGTAGAAVAAQTTTGSAQSPAMNHQMHQQAPGHMNHETGGHMMGHGMGAHRLMLTEEQQKQYDAIVKKTYADTAKVRSELWARSAELDALRMNPNASPEMFAPLADAIAGLRTTLDTARMDMNDKLEKALELACDNQAYDLDGIEDETCGHCQYCCDGCCHHEDMVDNPEEERPCLERVVEYYKRRAGIDS